MTHPRIAQSDQLMTPPASAAEMGYHMPAEWEPHCCIWVTRPHNPETWPGCIEKAVEQFDAWIQAMLPYVPVSTTGELNIDTNDSWIRDFGPIFVTRDPKAIQQRPQQTDQRGMPGIACHDFGFNGWGGKYEVRELDDLVPQQIAQLLKVPIWIHDFVLEGGSIDVNGKGTVLTTEQCLLNPNRNPNLTREQITAKLHETLGTHHVIWLPGGIVGDDTDGHIDDIARFVNPTTVVASSAPAGHPDHEMLATNLNVLRQARDQDSQKLTVVELPVPKPIEYDFPADRFGPGGVAPVPASYANFLISNGAIFVPVFGQPTDETALKCLEQLMPDRAIVPIRSEWLVVGLGSLHCLSQQQPIGAVA